MGMRPRLATVANQRGHLAVLVFHRAARDNMIDLAEQRSLRDALEDWQSATEAADLAGALAHAIETGVGAFDPRYLLARVADYRAAVDELPLDAA
jgi:hypothetical protein